MWMLECKPSRTSILRYLLLTAQLALCEEYIQEDDMENVGEVFVPIFSDHVDDYFEPSYVEENELEWSYDFFFDESKIESPYNKEYERFMDEKFAQFSNKISTKNFFDSYSEEINPPKFSSGNQDKSSDLEKENAPVVGNPRKKIIGGLTDPDMYTQEEIYITGKKDNCYFVYGEEHEEQCIQYFEQNCNVEHKEICSEAPVEECNIRTDMSSEKRCFEVEDSICKQVIFEKDSNKSLLIEAAAECGVNYDIEDRREYFQECLDVPKLKCWKQNEEVQDVTCTFSVEFDCGDDIPLSTDDCDTQFFKKCYKTPRKLKKKTCESKMERICKKVIRATPEPIKKRRCRNDISTVSMIDVQDGGNHQNLEQVEQDCKPRKKEVCGYDKKEKLRMECSDVKKNTCVIQPNMYCNEVPKQFCHLVKKVVPSKICPQNKQYQKNSLHFV